MRGAVVLAEIASPCTAFILDFCNLRPAGREHHVAAHVRETAQFQLVENGFAPNDDVGERELVLAICPPMDSKAPLFGLVEVGTDHLQQRGHAFGCDAVAVFQTDAFKESDELLCRVGLVLTQKLAEGGAIFS